MSIRSVPGIRRALALLAALLAVPSVTAVAGPPYLVASEFRVGGSGGDRLSDLALDAAGNAYVSGVVGSYDFPGIDTSAMTNAGVDLRFVAKYAPAARTPSFTAVVGSSTKSLRAYRYEKYFLRDELAGIAVDAGGNAFVAAYDAQVDFVATGGAYRETTGAKYVYKVSPSGAVARHSVALDPAIRRIAAIAVDAGGAVYLTGSATNGLATTAGAPYSTAGVGNGCIVPFAMKLAASGQSVAYATYLGTAAPGASCNLPSLPFVDPTGFAIAVDNGGNAYITGQAEPGVAATAGALDLGTKTPGFFYLGGQTGIQTASHAFVTKLGASGAILYSARLGGSLRDRGTSIAIDAAGNAVVAGKTSSKDFPRAGAGSADYPFVLIDCVTFNPEVGFLSKISPSGSQLLFSTYLPLDGGQLDDCAARFDGTLEWQPARVAFDPSGNIAVAGYTQADNRDLPSTTGAILPEPVQIDQGVGAQLLQVFSPAGALLYSSPIGLTGVHGIAFDANEVLTLASNTHLQRLVPGRLPVDIAISPNPACVGQPTTVTASVAGGFGAGTVDVTSDAVVVGSASVSNSVAVKAITPATAGIRKIRATYRGAGLLDGQSSVEVYLPVNQAGACQ